MTAVSDLRAQLSRRINVTGAEQLGDLTSGLLDGHILDGFWSARLQGMLAAYTSDGTDITKSSNGDDLPEHLQQMVVLFAAFHLIRMKIMQLAVNFSAKAGPVEYEQQASATVLRALLDSLEREIVQLKAIYSDQYGGAFYYMDGVLQSEYALLNQLAELTVL